MNRSFLIFGFLWLINLVNAQILPNRYNEEIFTSFTEVNDVIFSSGVPTPEPGGGFYEFITGYPLNVNEYETFNQDLKMDIFQPANDTITKRPLVILCFGGGFLAGSRDYWSIREIAQQLARRGYVTASIDYRLGMNVFDADLSKRAPYRGLQDARSAVRFFKADAYNSNTYKIDTTNIYVGGHSSGAFNALHLAYLDKEIERPLSTYEWIQDGEFVPDQLCIDCVGNNLSYIGNARAIFSLAGGVGTTDIIESSVDPPVVMFHSEDDPTVPYHSGQPFSSYLWLVIGSDLPDVYGSEAIAEKGDDVGLEYQFNSYEERGHNVHEESEVALYSDIIPKISDSFFVKLLKPIDHLIFGNSIVCDDALLQTYSTIENEAKYYEWVAIGGTIINENILNDNVTVLWDENSNEHKLFLTPYSKTAARGLKTFIEIKLNSASINIWNGGNGVWTNPSKWSNGHVPLICEDVLFPNEVIPIDIFIPSGHEAKIRSLVLGENVHLIQNPDSKMSLTTGGNIVINGEFTVQDTLILNNLSNPLIEHIELNGKMNVKSQAVLNLSK